MGPGVFLFQKPTDAVVRDGAIVPYAPFTDDFQHEIELVVALGHKGRQVQVKDANPLIFGYAIGLDMTRRDRQREARGLAWEVGKSFDDSAPCSAIYPFCQVGLLTSGTITLSVNGTERQRGNLFQLIWSIPEIISNLSHRYCLMPGDLIYTGTPAAVGPVQPGDKLEGFIERLGTLSITIGAEHA
jgi:fumarylpyruvate hydrolase